jgi:flagellar biosynthetic protein FlhB
MSEDSSEGDKPYEATERKLEEARRRGELPFSADIVTAGGYAGFAAFAALAGAGALAAAGTVLQGLLEQGLRTGPFAQDAAVLLREGLVALVMPLAGWFAAPAALALLAIFAQGGQVFAPTRIAPAWNKISPFSVLRQRLGPAGLVEFAKGLVKSTLIAVVLGIYLLRTLPAIIATVALDPRQVSIVLFKAVVDVIVLAAAVALVIGILDLVWQRLHFLMRQRMSRKELQDEMREAEGDPMVKGQRRQAAASAEHGRDGEATHAIARIDDLHAGIFACKGAADHAADVGFILDHQNAHGMPSRSLLPPPAPSLSFLPPRSGGRVEEGISNFPPFPFPPSLSLSSSLTPFPRPPFPSLSTRKSSLQRFWER